MATGRIPTTANSPLTAKGDLFTFSTGSAKLAVGNNGETLVADSSATTGLRYTAGNPISNPVLNSAFQVWQRGTTMSNPSSIPTAYGADRWNFYRPSGFTTGITMSRQTTSDTTNLPFIQYCARIQRTASNSSTLALYLTQNFESVNSIPYAGKTITLSYYARAGANFSSTSSILNAQVVTGTGTDQNIINGYTGSSSPLSGNATLTTTWQRFSVTGSISSSATQIAPYFEYTPVGTAGANDYYEVTGVQIDIGSVALPFRTYAGTIQGELAACQRYYFRLTQSANNEPLANYGNAVSSTGIEHIITFPVYMRMSPTTVDFANLAAGDGVNVRSNMSATTINNTSLQFGSIASTSSSLTQFRNYNLFNQTSTTAYIGFSAEL